MRAVAKNLYVCTDDGTYGFHGNVTNMLDELVLNEGKKYDQAIVIGPMIMMKFACLATKKLDIPTIVSLNTIMVEDRKSTRLNSSHANISYAVFCLKKKNTT